MMKFNTYTIALSVMMLAVSCSKASHEVQYGGDRILFSGPTVQTKATLISDAAGMTGGFSVYASRYTDSYVDHDFMTNLLVNTNGAYTGNQYYWAPGAGHTFFGLYPYYKTANDDIDKGISYEMDSQGKAVKVKQYGNEIIYAVDATGNSILPDILYGAAVYDDPYIPGADGSNPGRIRFDMKHACAVISFSINNLSGKSIQSVEAASGNPGLFITGLYDKAKLSVTTENGQAHAVWTELGDDVDRDFKIGVIDVGTSSWPHGTQRDWYSAIVIPQNFAKLSVGLSFIVNYTTGDRDTFHIKLSDIKTEGSEYVYLPGKHYQYKVDITNQDIMCYVNIVPWIEDDTIVLK